MAVDQAIRTHRAGLARSRALLAGLIAAVALSGCGVWLGEVEVPLEGERIALRQATPTDRRAEREVVTVPATRRVEAWTQAGGSPQRSAGNLEGSISLQRVWSASIGAGSGSESRIAASPVAGGGRVFALDASTEVMALSTSGDRLWRADLTPEDEDGRDGFGGGLALSGDTLVAATGFGEVIGLNATDGSEKWRLAIGAPVRSAPAIADGRVVVVSGDGQLVAADLDTGGELWRVFGLEGGAAMLGGAGPAISGEVVAAPFTSGDLGIFRAADGRRGWTEPLGGGRLGTAMSLITDLSASPVMADGVIYAGAVAGRVAALDVPTGRRIWSRDIGAYNSVLVAGAAFIVSADARVLALEPASGDTIWETALPRFEDEEDREDAIAYGGPIMVGGKLFVVSSDRRIYRLDGATGAIETSAGLPGETTIPPIFAEGRLYVLDDDGDLHAYQ